MMDELNDEDIDRMLRQHGYATVIPARCFFDLRTGRSSRTEFFNIIEEKVNQYGHAHRRSGSMETSHMYDCLANCDGRRYSTMWWISRTGGGR
jgi:hypothetical protein